MKAMGSSRRYRNPRDFLSPGGNFPDGPFTPDIPTYADRTAALVSNLLEAIKRDGRTQRQVALAAQIDPGTLSRLITGQAVPDLGTICSLEEALSSDLWAGRKP
jgi:DNA-binding phage protein